MAIAHKEACIEVPLTFFMPSIFDNTQLSLFQALWPYWRVHKGHLDGYLLHTICVFNALRLFFMTNFPGPAFIPCPTSIPDSDI